MSQAILQLYVAGESISSQRARDQVTALCRSDLSDWRLEVIDILLDPARAEAAWILATPTLVSQSNGRTRRIVGDLSDRARVLEFLGVIEGK